ncbi:MAG: hypothetical protein KGD70_07500 [Candidatus Lokiarchaeota archaeon]|nr:hypothetical protein [Candidatus Lokiarchaeota archaeon]
MEENELKKDMGWGSFVGIFALIALSIFVGGGTLFGVGFHFEQESVIYPAWTDLVGIVFAITVLIVFLAVWLLSSSKR